MTDQRLPGDARCDARRTFRHGRSVLLAVMLAGWTSAASAQSLPDLSVEELMKLDAGQVFGASGRLQPVTEAPASVSFITAEEIALYGYRTLADVLRSVRGMYVTDDRNFSFLGTRGFGKPGDYNSRILLLINGHRVNDNVYGQAEIGAEFGLDAATFQRVEVIRGPASSLYGDSAFFAVVNVITKSGASLAGGTVTLEAGTLGSQVVRTTVGHRLSNGLDFALSGTVERSDGVERLYFPVFDTPATNRGVAQGLDGEGVRQFYGHLAFNGLTVTGAYGTRQRDVPTASVGTLFNQQVPHEETTDRHTLLDADYGRSFRGARVTFRASFDRFTYDGTYPFAGEMNDSPPLVGHQNAVGTRWSVGTGVTRSVRGRQTLRAGFEFIDNIRQDQTAGYVDPPIQVLDIHRYSTQHAAYVQDEIKLARWLLVNAGLRYDGYGNFNRITPRAALIVLPSSTQSVKYLYGRAFRAPNAYELNDILYGAQVLNLRPESIDTHELVWERYVNDWLRTSVSTYWYKAERLITPVVAESAFLGTSFVNLGEVRAKGLELEAQVRLRGASRALVSYGLQRAAQQDDVMLGVLHGDLPNSPRHLVKARISVPGPTRRSILSAEAQYMSSRETLGGFRVSPVALVNFTMVQPLGVSWELFGAVRNIFDSQYADPGSSGHLQDSIPQNGRTARIGLRWKVWGK